MQIPVPHHEGSGEPLVLLHGFTDTWRGWTPVLPGLAAHHEVFAWSLPGHGGGTPWDPALTVTPEALVDAVEAQLDAAGLERAHLVGNSLGGWLALALAARGRALSVVGVCPAGGWEPSSRDERRLGRSFRANQLLLRYLGWLLPWVARHPRLRRLALRDVVVDGSKVPEEAARSLFEGARDCRIVDGVLALVNSGTALPLGPVDVPVRILYGDKDRLLRWPSCYPRLRRAFAGADWVRLDGMGHLPMWDQPEAVVAAVVEHTRRAAGGEGHATSATA